MRSFEPRTEAGRAGWAALLAEPGRALVALDYDGVLAPIVDEPSEAWPAPGAGSTSIGPTWDAA